MEVSHAFAGISYQPRSSDSCVESDDNRSLFDYNCAGTEWQCAGSLTRVLCGLKRHSESAADIHTMSRTSNSTVLLLGIRLVGPAYHGWPALWGSVGRLENIPLLRIGQCKTSAERTLTLAAYNVTPVTGPHFGCVAVVLWDPWSEFRDRRDAFGSVDRIPFQSLMETNAQSCQSPGELSLNDVPQGHSPEKTEDERQSSQGYQDSSEGKSSLESTDGKRRQVRGFHWSLHSMSARYFAPFPQPPPPGSGCANILFLTQEWL